MSTQVPPSRLDSTKDFSSLVPSAFGRANLAFAQANAAFAQANTGGGSSTDAYARDTANAGFITANSASSFANGSFLTANSASSFANGAFDRANASYTKANTATIYTASSAAPSSPKPGDQWYLTTTDVLYEYINDGTSNNWVDITSPTISNGTTSSASTETISPFLLMGA